MRGAPGASRLATTVFVLLVTACFAAFFIAQHLKHIPTAVQQLVLNPAFYPEGGGTPRGEPISFQIEKPDLVTIEVIGPSGEVVATIVHRRAIAAYKQVTLFWNGRRGLRGNGYRPPRGRLAPEGSYRVLIRLHDRGLEVRSPKSFRLVRRGGG